MTTMDPQKTPSEATDICNTVIYVHLKTVKVLDTPFMYGISFYYLWGALKTLQASQDYQTKYFLPNIIKDT